MADNGNGFDLGFTPGETPIPTSPTELPVPDIPAADFTTIGQQFAAGVDKSGLAAKTLSGWLDAIADIIGKIIAALLGLVLFIIAKLIGIYMSGFAGAESEVDQVAAAAIQGMTGVSVPSGSFSSGPNWGSRSEVGPQVAQKIIQALFGNYANGTPAAIAPSDAGATRFMSFGMRLAIEGWLQGFLLDMASLHHVTQLGELKDAIERTMGLGRMMRRAFAAPMKILVEDPFTWLLNRAYRPTLLGPTELVRAYIRGAIDLPALNDKLGYHGYAADLIDDLVKLNQLHLGAADLELLRLHGDLSAQDVRQRLRDQGYTDADAALITGALTYARYDAWNKTLVTEALAALEKRQIDRPTFDNILDNSGLPSDERDILGKYADFKVQIGRTRFSIAEGQQLVEKGLWTLDQFRDLATFHGYSTDDETDLELLLLGKIKDQTDAAAKKAAAAKSKADAAAAKQKAQQDKAAAAAAAAEAKGVSLAKFAALVQEGSKTIADYAAFLKAKGIAPDNIAALVAEEQAKLDKAKAAAAPAAPAAATAKQKGLNLSELKTAYTQGLIDVNTLQQRISASGVSGADAALLVEEIVNAKQATDAKEKAREDAKAAAAIKHINLGEIQRSVRLGVTTVPQYQDFLVAHGFASEDVAVLVSDMNAQLAKDSTAKKNTQAATAAAKAKGISLSQLQKLVRAGVKTPADYTAAVVALGYSADDAAAMTDYLQLQIQQDQETLAARGRAASLPTQRVLSTTELEKLAKAGVVGTSVYTDALVKSGVSQADAQTLTLALAASIKSAKTAAGTVQATSKQLSAKGLSLGKLETDVLDKKLTLDQLNTILSGNGVNQDQVDSIDSVLQDELDNQAAVAKLTADATARAASKNLSLAEETAAVKNGVKSIADYSAFVTALGFDPADAATLVQTLQAELAKAKATTKKTPATPAPGATGG